MDHVVAAKDRAYNGIYRVTVEICEAVGFSVVKQLCNLCRHRCGTSERGSFNQINYVLLLSVLFLSQVFMMRSSCFCTDARVITNLS